MRLPAWRCAGGAAGVPASPLALGRLCGMLGYHFRPVICVILGERGAEMLRHSTGVDAKALGRLLTVVCAKVREQIWRREEEKDGGE